MASADYPCLTHTQRFQTTHADRCIQPLQHTQHRIQKHCLHSNLATLAKPGGFLPAPEGPTSAISSPGTTMPEVGCRICLLSMVCLSNTCSIAPLESPSVSQHTHTQVAMINIMSGKEVVIKLHYKYAPCKPGRSMQGLQGIGPQGHPLQEDLPLRWLSTCGGACSHPAHVREEASMSGWSPVVLCVQSFVEAMLMLFLSVQRRVKA